MQIWPDIITSPDAESTCFKGCGASGGSLHRGASFKGQKGSFCCMNKGSGEPQKWSKAAPPSVPPPEALYEKCLFLRLKDVMWYVIIFGIFWSSFGRKRSHHVLDASCQLTWFKLTPSLVVASLIAASSRREGNCIIRGQKINANFFCTKFFENPSGHERPRRKSWTSAPKSVFSCGSGDGEKLFDPWASGRKGQEYPQKIWTKKFMFMLYFLPWIISASILEIAMLAHRTLAY